MAQSPEIDRFMQNVTVRIPGALDSMIRMEMFNVLDVFCRETNAWQEDIPLEVNSTDTEYDIDPEEYRGQIIRLLGVTVDGAGTSLNIWMPSPDKIKFSSPPQPTSAYVATVALSVIDPVNPGDSLPEVPDWFFTRYFQDLLDGILYRMMGQPLKPYSSPQGVLFHGRQWRSALSQIKAEIEAKNTYGAQTWRFPAFAQCRK